GGDPEGGRRRALRAGGRPGHRFGPDADPAGQAGEDVPGSRPQPQHAQHRPRQCQQGRARQGRAAPRRHLRHPPAGAERRPGAGAPGAALPRRSGGGGGRGGAAGHAGRTAADRGLRPAYAGAPPRGAPAPPAGLLGPGDAALAGRGRADRLGADRPAARHRRPDRGDLDRRTRGRDEGAGGVSASPLSLAQARAMLLSPLGPVARAGQDASRPRVSFEFFPPKSDEAEASLWKAVTRLAPLKPEFVSVTYGAGGSTRERTHRTVQRILAETELTPAAHLTCVEASREEVDAVIDGYR